MQIKTTIRYHFTLITKAIIERSTKNKDKMKRSAKNVQKMKSSYNLGGTVNDTCPREIFQGKSSEKNSRQGQRSISQTEEVNCSHKM